MPNEFYAQHSKEKPTNQVRDKQMTKPKCKGKLKAAGTDNDTPSVKEQPLMALTYPHMPSNHNTMETSIRYQKTNPGNLDIYT